MKTSLVERARRLLVHRRLPLAVGLLAFVLMLPSVGYGFLVDDQLHAFYLRGGDVPGGPRGIWDLYRFADGGAGTREAIDTGQFPWWTDPTLRFGFMRPLSSLWITLDHLVLGPTIAHLASCAAYGLLAYVVARLLGRFAPGAAGGLAAILFAVDDSHNFTVLWIANRHALTSALLGFAALLFHVRRREDGRGSAWLPPLLLALAFAAGESTLGVLPYFVAYAWWLDPAAGRSAASQAKEPKEPKEPKTAGRKEALLALVPCGIATLAWAAAFVAGNYGTAGSALYLDPIGQPGAFARSIVVRLPQLLVAQLGGMPADLFALMPPEAVAGAFAFAVVLLALIVFALYRLTRHHRAAPALAFATSLTLIPCCATFPSDRLLLLAGLGAFGLIGIAIARVAQDVVAQKAKLRGLAFAGAMLLVHFVGATALLPARTVLTATVFGGAITRGAATLPTDEAVRDQTMVIVSTPDALIATYMFLDRQVSGQPSPRFARLLAASQRGTVTLTRTTEHDFELRSDAPLNSDVFSLLYRPDRYRVGDVYVAGALTVTVLEVDAEGWPRVLRAHFDAIDPKTHRFVAWRGKGFVEQPFPKVGDSLVVPSTPWDEAMGM
jgi:hypothetical protein